MSVTNQKETTWMNDIKMPNITVSTYCTQMAAWHNFQTTLRVCQIGMVQVAFSFSNWQFIAKKSIHRCVLFLIHLACIEHSQNRVNNICPTIFNSRLAAEFEIKKKKEKKTELNWRIWKMLLSHRLDYITAVLLPHCHRFYIPIFTILPGCAKIRLIKEKIWHLITLDYWTETKKCSRCANMIQNFNFPTTWHDSEIYSHMIYSHNRFIGI